ncbi:hypothetical protein B0H11DRAFT_1992878, partial [Mycena galericulata]
MDRRAPYMGRPAAGAFWVSLAQFWLFGERILLGLMVWLWVGLVLGRWNWVGRRVGGGDLFDEESTELVSTTFTQHIRRCAGRAASTLIYCPSSYVAAFNAHRLGCNMCILHMEPRTHAPWFGCVCCWWLDYRFHTRTRTQRF